MEAIGHFRLLLCIVFYLDLKDIFVVPLFRWNLVSVSYLDKLGYLCSFGNNVFRLSFNLDIVRTGSLLAYDNLYLLDTVASYGESFNAELRGTKCRIDNTDSGTLWHKCLGHISKNIIERLMSNEILDSIDFTSFDVCVECIKGKQTKNKKLGAYRATYILELIHTNICGSFHIPSWNG